jgi:hypothetical protein
LPDLAGFAAADFKASFVVKAQWMTCPSSPRPRATTSHIDAAMVLCPLDLATDHPVETILSHRPRSRVLLDAARRKQPFRRVVATGDGFRPYSVK